MTDEIEEKKLTYKEQRFIQFYVTSARFNGSLAHELAGYKAKNTHVRSTLAAKLLAKDSIKSKVEAILQEEHKQNTILKTEIRRFYEAILRADYNKLVKFRATSIQGKTDRKSVV